MKSAIPILRIFDETKAREHYAGYLGFQVDWEYRFEPDTPIFMQVSRDACVLNLSEHVGDGTPGTFIRVETPDLFAFHESLRAKPYKYFRPPEPIEQPWGLTEFYVTDPFGNRLIFYRRTAG